MSLTVLQVIAVGIENIIFDTTNSMFRYIALNPHNFPGPVEHSVFDSWLKMGRINAKRLDDRTDYKISHTGQLLMTFKIVDEHGVHPNVIGHLFHGPQSNVCTLLHYQGVD